LIVAILVVMVVVGVVLVFCGLWAFFKMSHQPEGGKVKVDGLITIESKNGSLFLIACGIASIAVTLVCAMQFSSDGKTIELREEQLLSFATPASNLAAIPLDRLSTEGTAFPLERVLEYQTFQTQVLNTALQLTNDDQFKFHTDTALIVPVLRGLEAGSFGLATIARDQFSDARQFLARSTSDLASDLESQLQIGRIYRSLYNSNEIEDTEKGEILEKWRAVIENLERIETEDQFDLYRVNQHIGLYFMNRGIRFEDKSEIEKSLEYLLRANEFAPEEERHKTQYNLGNVYAELGDYERVLEYSQRSAELVEAFWPAQFNIGIAYLRLGNHENSATAFVNADEISDASGEGDLLERYIAEEHEALQGIQNLCGIEAFETAFSTVCSQ